MPGVDSRFVFRGSAVGAAGRLVIIQDGKSVNQTVPSQAASYLPVTGGLSEATTKKCRVLSGKGLKSVFLALGSATTRAESESEGLDRLHTTVVKCEAEAIEMIGRIRIASVSVQLTSTYKPGDEYSRIVPDVAVINGMTLDGCPLKISYELQIYRKCPTRKSLAEYYAANEKVRQKSFALFAAASPECQQPPESKGVIVATVVSKVEWLEPANKVEGVVFDGNVIRWPEVGAIYLGELLISDSSRRLTMVRAEFGDNQESLRALAPAKRMISFGDPGRSAGSVSLGEAEANGTTIP